MTAHHAREATGSSKAEDLTRALNAIRAVVRALRIDTRTVERELGISLAQLFVLQQLADRPAESLNELANRTATHQSSVSVVVRRLVRSGFVTRASSDNDKRRVTIALTPPGRAILARAPVTIQVRLMNALNRMPAADRHLLGELLERWIVDAGIDMVAPPMLGEDVRIPKRATPPRSTPRVGR